METTQKKMAITILTVLTGIIHLLLGIAGLGDGIDFLEISFILNGLGYFSLILALNYLPQFKEQRVLIKNILIIFTLITFLAYWIINSIAESFIWAATRPGGVIDKLIELALIFLLFTTDYSTE